MEEVYGTKKTMTNKKACWQDPIYRYVALAEMYEKQIERLVEENAPDKAIGKLELKRQAIQAKIKTVENAIYVKNTGESNTEADKKCKMTLENM